MQLLQLLLLGLCSVCFLNVTSVMFLLVCQVIDPLYNTSAYRLLVVSGHNTANQALLLEVSVI